MSEDRSNWTQEDWDKDDAKYLAQIDQIAKPESMTLQQQLEEEIEFWRNRDLSPTANDKVEVGVVVVKTDYLISRLSTLQAILDIEKKEPLPMRSIAGDSFMEGYNSALSTVAEAAQEGMRG